MRAAEPDLLSAVFVGYHYNRVGQSISKRPIAGAINEVETFVEGPAIHITEWRRSVGLDASVVMIHGSAQGSSVGGDRHFYRQSQLTSKGWRVIVPDRPGHGRSPAPGRPDDPDEDGRWVVALLGAGAHLVGHSFGGCVALAAAAKKPAAVKSLTLVEPALQNLASDSPQVQAWGARIGQIYASAATPTELAARFGTLAGIPYELLRGGLSDAEQAMEMDRLGRGLREIRLPSAATIRSSLVRISKAGVPLLVVSGGWNPGIDAVAEAAARAGAGRHVILRSDHHFPQLASNDFNTLLHEFMGGHEGGSRFDVV